MDKISINVGCGPCPLPGWVNIDNDPEVESSTLKLGLHFVRAEANNLPFANNSVYVVYSSHLLEHFVQMGAKEGGIHADHVLKEFYRVLEPGGHLMVAVPDLAVCCSQVLLNRRQQKAWIHFLMGYSEKAGATHRYGYTKEFLEETLVQCGFVLDGCFAPWAKRPGGGFDASGGTIPDDLGRPIYNSLNLHCIKPTGILQANETKETN